MLTVKLSTSPCVFCGTLEDTALAKEKDHDFSGVVCAQHLFELLRKWDESFDHDDPRSI